jgi:plasmid stability protein
VVGSGQVWVVEGTNDYAGDVWHVVAILELGTDGSIVRDTRYYTQKSEAPSWRAEWAGLRNETPLPNKSDIVVAISEVVVMEQILIRNLPAGTKAALRARAEQRHRSVEAEARDLLTRALEGEPVTIVDLLSTDEGADIEFEPERLGLTARSAEL